MMLLFIALLATLVIFILLYVLVTTKSSSVIMVKNRLQVMGRGSDEKKPADMYWHEQMNRSLYERLVKPAIDSFVNKIAKIAPSTLRKEAEELVEYSGGFYGLGFNGFVLAVCFSIVFFVLLAIWRVRAVGSTTFGIIFMLALGFAAGVYAPFLWLRHVVGVRREAIRRAMPDVLDLLCVSVQAGLGFDGALGKVAAKMKGPLIEEFERLLQELRMGVTRRNALTRLADRCGIEEMRLFTAALIQAEKLGVGMAQVLEIQAENMREIRRQRAKEMAAKLPVKILFPTIIFIFPVLFVVVLGPAIVSLIDTMSKK